MLDGQWVAFDNLFGQHLLDLLIAEQDLMHRLSAVLEGDIVAVHVRWQKYLGVPYESLARGEVGDQPRLAIIPNIDSCALLLGNRRA